MTTLPKNEDAQVREQPAVAQPARPERRIGWPGVGQTVLSAALLGFILHWRYGYVAGTGDHLVLSALGRHWADPSAYANDWVIANAPQPHWFFDMVTWFGAVIGHLGAVYLAYWIVGLVVFGAATSILAKRWAPEHPWVATVLVTVIGGITPWWLLGTGSPMLAIALPGVLAGFLVYLALAALLTGRYRLAGMVAVVTAIVHVQQGGVLGVLLLAVGLVELFRSRPRRAEWWLFGGAAACFAIMFASLKARPVAGDMNDFAQACRQLIPYHCEASSWPSSLVWQGFALVGLALATVLYMTRATWPVWAATLALTALGLAIGVTVDRWDVPTLGVLAQGLNIYRLDVLLMPFAAWGLLAPIFVKQRVWVRWVSLAVVLYLTYQVLNTHSFEPVYPLVYPRGGNWIGVAAVALVLGVLWVSLGRKFRFAIPAMGVVVAGSIFVSMWNSTAIELKPLDPAFIPDTDIRLWGEAVQRVVPPGEQLVAHPLGPYVRMVTERGVVADCKNGPYGGPAWHEYQARINAMGGFGQCRTLDPSGFDNLTPSQVSTLARTYQAGYLVVEVGQADDMPGLKSLGWTEVLGPVGPVENHIFKAPWAR
ncbi:MAG: hypothetical protein ABW224_12225 [Kibdelosporangium sp.]